MRDAVRADPAAIHPAAVERHRYVPGPVHGHEAAVAADAAERRHHRIRRRIQVLTGQAHPGR